MADRPRRSERALRRAVSGGSMSAAVLRRIGSEDAERPLCAAVVAAGARWSDGQRELVRLVPKLDTSGEWIIDGAPSCAHWVAGALDIELCTAREWLRIGRALAKLKVVDAAFEEGRLSYSKLRVLTRVATPENEVELCDLAERVPAGRLRHAIAAWLQRHETPDDTEARHEAARGLWWRTDVDGMVAGCFRLPPGRAAFLAAAVDAEVMRRQASSAPADASRTGAPWPSLPQQRADALINIVRAGGVAVETEVILHVRGDGCTLDDGTPVADSVVERVAPEAFLRVLIHDAESRPINASGRQRHPTARQRRVVRERDRACVDCGSIDFLHYDHEPAYEQSHQTVIDELKLRCGKCHRARHRKEREQAGGDSPHQA
jgi:hypothetical protein